jgi:hypothetical protein
VSVLKMCMPKPAQYLPVFFNIWCFEKTGRAHLQKVTALAENTATSCAVEICEHSPAPLNDVRHGEGVGHGACRFTVLYR